MSKKTFVTLFHRCILLSLSKDVVMIPSIMQKEYNYQSKFVCLRDNEDDEVKKRIDIEIEFLSAKYRDSQLRGLFPRFAFCKFLIKESLNIDVLNLYHFTPGTLILSLIYKIFNHKGIIYLKGDYDERNYIKYNKKRILLMKCLARIVDIISLETTSAINIFKDKFPKMYSKIVYIPNGIDYSIPEYSCFKKENLFLSVGRIGTYQKNSDMILSVLKNIDLEDWKFVFIGPIDIKFQQSVDSFFKKFPDKRGNVIFLGPLFDRKVLLNYFSKARVFCLTSRFESFGIVLIEALFYDNYILSTDVGAARDITCEFKYGKEIKDVDQFEKIINDIISKKIDLSNFKVPKMIKDKFDYKTTLGCLNLLIERLVTIKV